MASQALSAGVFSMIDQLEGQFGSNLGIAIVFLNANRNVWKTYKRFLKFENYASSRLCNKFGVFHSKLKYFQDISISWTGNIKPIEIVLLERRE